MNEPDSTASDAPRTDALRIVLAAGGTGGHVMPALATAAALEQRARCDFLVIGSPRAGERDLRGLVPYPVVEVRARALANVGALGKLVGAATLPLSVLTALRHLVSFRPHLVIATGGYVSGPTGIAAWLARIPLLVLEQNAAPGITTRWLRPFARALAVSFPQTARRLGAKAIVTGNPIRSTLPAASRRDRTSEPADRTETLRLLILGGSQGARGLNTMAQLAAPFLADAEIGLTVTHQTGKRSVETLRRTYSEYGIPAIVTPFINNIGEAYACADLVCARAGATTVAEIAYCGLPSILVPFPQAAGRHQHANATALEVAGAAVVVEQEANGVALAREIIDLATDRDRLSSMAAAAAGCGRDDAAAAVAELALSLVSTGNPARLPGPDQPVQHPREPRTNRILRTTRTT